MTTEQLTQRSSVAPLSRYDQYLPTGTRIRAANDRNYWWEKVSDGVWSYQGSGQYTLAQMNIPAPIIHQLPGGPVEVPVRTSDQFRWEFFTGALGAAYAHGVDVRSVREALSRMGLDDVSNLPMGAGVAIGDPNVRDRLPEGSVVYTGTVRNTSALGVYRRINGRWEHIFGDRSVLDNMVTVAAVSDDLTAPEWVSRTGDQEDTERIKEFKATAWREGWRLKMNNSWCGTYESIIHSLGVTEADVQAAKYRGITPGQRTAADEVASLPEGSLLWWEHSSDPEQFALFVRDDNASNMARTRRVFRSEAADHGANFSYKRSMIPISINDYDASDRNSYVPTYPLPNDMIDRIWPLLPPGTIFTFAGGGGSRYIMCQNGNATAYGTGMERSIPEAGPYTRQGFGAEPRIRVVSVP